MKSLLLLFSFVLFSTHSLIAENEKPWDPTKQFDAVYRQLLTDFPEYYVRFLQNKKASRKLRLKHARMILKSPLNAAKAFAEIVGSLNAEDLKTGRRWVMRSKEKFFRTSIPTQAKRALKNYRQYRTHMVEHITQKHFRPNAANKPKHSDARDKFTVPFEHEYNKVFGNLIAGVSLLHQPRRKQKSPQSH